eukprot:TRINITY_DN8464_c0_g1_i1.p1 TRINITY_DN8464_c0_g1~~TRINITY_DN8464_c0_g1_i1.p1  ORF type:complete len:139 (-),score=47.35 TRINITY_DN8464_c0_g1_i1:91-507(-)
MIRRPPRSTLSSSSAASDVYKRQYQRRVRGARAEMGCTESKDKDETKVFKRDLTETQSTQLQTVFEHVDTDEDGKITHAEVLSKLSKPETEAFFKKYDRNMDAMIDMQEWLGYFESVEDDQELKDLIADLEFDFAMQK